MSNNKPNLPVPSKYDHPRAVFAFACQFYKSREQAISWTAGYIGMPIDMVRAKV